MIESIDLNSWSDFQNALQDARNRLQGRAKEQLLYRGHADANWNPSTTLERRTTKEFSVQKYLEAATRHSAELGSISGRAWGNLHSPDLIREFNRTATGSLHMNLPGYSYLVYLRQHGFASPLLDWTTSPYIAAFFAFHGIDNRPQSKRVAVLVYSETPDGVKQGRGQQAFIQKHGPYTATHSRHFVQQCWYTTAQQWAPSHGGRDAVFVAHSDVLGRREANQDRCLKITMPYSERQSALTWLANVNINLYTLFQTEDSLVKAIESRVFDLDD